MKKTKTLYCGVLLVGLLLIGTIPVAAQPPDSTKLDESAMMSEWMKYAAPGPMHKEMEKMVGNWAGTSIWWMEPGAPPAESAAKAEYKMIMGGRYLVQDYVGDAMGQPFNGMGITAYDNFKEQFITIWFDDMSTGIMISYGTMDSTGTVTYTGTADDPMTGRKDVPMRIVSRFIDDDTAIMEMYGPDAEGNEFKTMEITYKRQK